MKTALVFGIHGQDGSFLAELLLSKGYRISGFSRGVNSSNISGEIDFIAGDVSNPDDVFRVIKKSNPDEIYNLSSLSQPGLSWSAPLDFMRVNGIGALNIFESARLVSPKIKIFQASSSEMFAKSALPQSELSPFSPQNPYAASKVYAHNMANIYRKTYQMHISCGILFNHESERRPLSFLPQKVAYGAACAALGIDVSMHLNEVGEPIVNGGLLKLGNMSASRDWGYAPDYVNAMWLMLQHQEAKDYVIGTGIAHSVEDLCACAYGSVGLNWRDKVISSPNLYRPVEPCLVSADSSLAKVDLGWSASKTFVNMISDMVSYQVTNLKNIGNRE